MDCHNILRLLTDCSNCGNGVVKDENLSNVLSRIFPCIPINILDEIVQDRNTTSDSHDTGWHFLHLLLYTLKKLSCTEFADENAIFTVEQYRTIKAAIASSASIGIVPSLLPQIKTHLSMVRASKSTTFKLNLDGDGIMEKYKRLSQTTTIFLELFEKSIFRAAVMAQLDCLLAALLQLAHAPLKKPIDNQDSTSVLTADFEMTPQLYLCLKNEQSNFHIKLQSLMENCPQSQLIKELMVLLSIKNIPKWLQVNIKRHLTKRIMLPGGILALALAVCDEVSDLGKCWNKLDVTAKLVARSHGIADTEEYYTSVCSQILALLNSKENKQSIIIAKACTTALYDYNSQVCIEKIMNTIMEPLLVKYGSNSKNSAVVRTEDQVSCSIQNLCQLFTTDAEFRCLPSTLLLPISLPLFYLHIKSYKSIYVLRNQVRQLILKVLQDETTMRETLFAIFLNHEIADHSKYGEKLNFLFGTDGALEISSECATADYEELTDCMFNLVEKDGDLVCSLFKYLLKVLPKMNNVTVSVEKGKLLESPEDLQERIIKQIFAVKLLALCSSSSLVQQAQVKEPEPFLDFIKFYFSKTIADFDDTCAYEQDANILYTSLLFVKMILTDCDVCKSWSTFQDFTLSVKREFNFKKVPAHVVSLIEEIESLVRKKGKSKTNYYDLSADGRKMNEFDKAFNDLADPLLPVRGHGIITLTKLIESRHPETTLKKDLLLCIFQENLNHEDSFIYLAAINGLCAMSSMIPEQVLEILVHEFIGLTQSKSRDVTPETRAKLGEILVKTTRALGEVTPKYKSLLVNAFLCGARDPDPLVRASSLSCLGEFCKIMGFRLGNLIIEILYCVGCIIKTDKDDTCRRAGVLVATLLLRGLGKDALSELGENLVTLYRSLKHLRDTDKDPVLQLHAQLALEEFDDIVQKFLFAKPTLTKSIFLLSD